MTKQLAPETIFNDALEKSVSALTQGITELEIRRLQHYASPLKRVDVAEWYEIELHIAALRNEFPEQDRLFESAYNNSADRVGTVRRYLVALGSLGRTAKLKEQFDRFSQLLRNDPESIRLSSLLLVAAGWFFTASKFASELDRLGATQLPTIPCALPICQSEQSTLNETAVSEEAVAEVVGYSHQYLRSINALPVGVETSVVPYEDGKFGLMYQFRLNSTPELASDAEWQLFEVLAEKGFPVEQSGMVVFSVLAGGQLGNGNNS